MHDAREGSTACLMPYHGAVHVRLHSFDVHRHRSQYLASVTEDDHVHVWNRKQWTKEMELDAMREVALPTRCRQLTWAPDGSGIVVTAAHKVRTVHTQEAHGAGTIALVAELERLCVGVAMAWRDGMDG